MKRVFVSLLLLLPITLVGCSSDGPSGGTGGASKVALSTDYLNLPGTTSTTFDVTANGPWRATASETWLALSPTSGSGSATVSVTVDRGGLDPGRYLGKIMVKGGTDSAAIAVFMRFAQITGNVTGPSDKILPAARVENTRVKNTQAVASSEAYVPGQVLMKVAAGYLAARAASAAGAHATSVPSAAGPHAGKLVGSAPQTYAPQAVRSASSAIAATHALTIAGFIAPGSPWSIVDTNGRSVDEVVVELSKDPRVAAVEPNLLLKPSDLHAATRPDAAAGSTAVTPNDTYYAAQWDMTLLGMEDAWGSVTGTGDVVVGVVDSGVMTGHPDLQPNAPYAGYDFVQNQAGAQTPVSDGSYHGTHVAGTIGAVGNNGEGVAGMNWQLSLLPARACDKNGCAVVDVVRALEYTAGFTVYDGNSVAVTPPAQAKVVNLSLGSPTATQIEQDAIALVTGNGTSVVVSSGNDATTCTSPPSYDQAVSPSPVQYPAAYAGVIAVGSVDYDMGDDSFAPSCFSDGGSQLWVAAPGGWLFEDGTPVGVGTFPDETGYGALGIVSTFWDATSDDPTYASDEGTSMAAPHVAGLVALMLAENPSLTPTEVKLILANTANGTGAHDDFLGYGMVAPVDAIAAARLPVTANASDFTVLLLQGGTVIGQTRADAGGNFVLDDVPAGAYTLQAGNDLDRDGVLGEYGEFYGSTTVTVGDDGDVTGVGLDVQQR